MKKKEPCDECRHGTMYCVEDCDFYHVRALYKKYPKELKSLYDLKKAEAQKMVDGQEIDDEDEGDDDGYDDDEE